MNEGQNDQNFHNDNAGIKKSSSMHKKIEANDDSSKVWDYVNTDKIKEELDEDEHQIYLTTSS